MIVANKSCSAFIAGNKHTKLFDVNTLNVCQMLIWIFFFFFTPGF